MKWMFTVNLIFLCDTVPVQLASEGWNVEKCFMNALKQQAPSKLLLIEPVMSKACFCKTEVKIKFFPLDK